MKLVRYFYNKRDKSLDNRHYLFWIWSDPNECIKIYRKDGSIINGSVHPNVESHWIEITEEEVALMI